MRHRRNEYGNLLAILGTVIMSVFISELRGASFESERETGSGASLEVSAKS